MGKRDKLSDEAVRTFVEQHRGWEPKGAAISRTYAFESYARGITFTVEVAFAAERRDHHPDFHIGWRKVTVDWTTHDSGGVTAVDVEMAELCDRIFGA